MNPQTPPTPQPGGEVPRPVSPEQPLAQPEQTPVVPQPEVAGAAAAASSATPAPQLAASDVAAAIAQMPGGTPPPAGPGVPTVAADQDVIEPEWVDQAEAAIVKNAGDPHAEEEAIETLQVDYLQKRYGHNVKPADGDA